MQTPTLQKLRKNLRQDFSGLRGLRLALLGDSSTQLLHQAIRGYGYEVGWNIEIWEADYDQADMQILDPGSEFYASRPDAVLVVDSTRKLLRKFNATPPAARAEFAANVLDRISRRWQAMHQNGLDRLICANFPEEDDKVFGQYAAKMPGSFIHQLRKANVLLQEFAVAQAGVHVLDLAWLQNELGRERFFSPAMYVTAELTLSVDALPHAARQVVQILSSAAGVVKKCLILDLDNTLWGGIVGDDGWENLQVGGLGEVRRSPKESRLPPSSVPTTFSPRFRKLQKRMGPKWRRARLTQLQPTRRKIPNWGGAYEHHSKSSMVG